MTETPGILVVDDQPATLTALEELLAPLGHNVTTARSGEEALRRLLDEDFGVIVMDVRMPGMDGFETVELIRQRRRHEHTAIMFLTAADADAEQIRRGYSAGAVDYIVKPVDPDVLRSKVAMLLALVQKNAELRESERRFRAAFESAPIGMGLSSVDGRWIEVNNALCDMLGLPRADLLERPPAELAHPEDRERHQSALERVMRDRRGFHQAELRFIRSDGEVGYALVSLSLSLDTQERPLHLIWQVLDMTDRRRAAMETAARVRAETLAGTLSKLQQVTAAALEQQRLRGTLEALVEGIGEAFGADLARILLRDAEDESRLRVGAASGFRGLAPGAPVPLTGVLDQVLAGPRTITLADLSAGDRAGSGTRRGEAARLDGHLADGEREGGGSRGGRPLLLPALERRRGEPARPHGRPCRLRDRQREGIRAPARRRWRCSSTACSPRSCPSPTVCASAPSTSRAAPWGATGTTRSSSAAGGSAWRWATWLATVSGPRR